MTDHTLATSPPRVAIIGAGLAGVGVAHALHRSGLGSLVFEKSRGAGGRTASRRREGFTYDFGANFFGPEPREAFDLLSQALGDDCTSLRGDVWTFDREGSLSPGDPGRQHARYSARGGINRAAKSVLADAPSAILIASKRIDTINGHAGSWKLTCDQGEEHGPFAAVVMTAPAPQSASIAASADSELAYALERVVYDAQFSVALALLEPAPVDEAIGALLSMDSSHPMAWITVEERKASHAPSGSGLLVVQMSPAWTAAHYETERETVSVMAQAHVEKLLGARVCEVWSDVQRWRYALPTSQLDSEAADRSEIGGLFVAGDARVGKGRATAALQNGLETGRRVASYLQHLA